MLPNGGRARGYPYLISMLPVFLIKYAPSPTWYDHLFLILSLLSTLLNLIRFALFNMILLLWYNILALIRSTEILFSLIWYDSNRSNPIPSDIIFSIPFDTLTLLCSDSLYSAHSIQIQSSCSLFPDLISPLHSSKLMNLLKIIYY